MMKLIFEAFGTCLLTMLFIATGGTPTFLIGFYVLCILAWHITGAHYNPIVTLAYMLRRDEKQIGLWLGLLFITF